MYVFESRFGLNLFLIMNYTLFFRNERVFFGLKFSKIMLHVLKNREEELVTGVLATRLSLSNKYLGFTSTLLAF